MTSGPGPRGGPARQRARRAARRAATGARWRNAPARDRAYFALMALCLTLFVLAWAVVRLVSVPGAIAMTALAMAIPPLAVIIANAGDEASRRR